jgi:hypothetical protein
MRLFQSPSDATPNPLQAVFTRALRVAQGTIMNRLALNRLKLTKPHAAVRCALALLCGLLLSVAAAAQRQPAPRPSPSPAAAQSETQTADMEHADLAITANVTARELRFEVVPNPTVEFPGQPERKTVWAADRQNLPRPVQPFTTYRDIGVRLIITSVFADIDRIVAEALGETPPTDDTPPPTNTTTPPPAAPTTPVVKTSPRPAAPVAHTAPARRSRRAGRL